MPTYAYFETDPVVNTVTADTPAAAAKAAAEIVGKAKAPDAAGVATYRLWFVQVDSVKAVDATYTVTQTTKVDVRVAP